MSPSVLIVVSLLELYKVQKHIDRCLYSSKRCFLAAEKTLKIL